MAQQDELANKILTADNKLSEVQQIVYTLVTEIKFEQRTQKAAAVLLSATRVLLKKKLSDQEIEQYKDAINAIHLPAQYARAVRQSAQKKTYDKRRRSVIDVSNTMTQIIEQAQSDLRSGKTTWMLLSLVLLTGRRPVEICEMGNFVAIDHQNINFSGQAKARDQDRDSLRIPVLDDAYVIIEAIKEIRDRHPNWVNRNLPSKEMNARFTKTYKTLIDSKRSDVRSYLLRALYAHEAYHRLALSERKQTTLSAYIGDILGHQETSSASFNYESVRVRELQ
jgi:hypothetical protein